MIIIISAIGEGGVIGSDRGLPWSIPDEYNQFLDHVRGNTIIMGRVSWEIFGADLPETRFIVVSSGLPDKKGAIIARSMEEAIGVARRYPEPIFIAGGSGIYKEGLKYADKMYLSFIKGSYEGDRFFPDFDESEWIMAKSVNHKDFVYKEFIRKN